jgi:ferredoxin
MRIVLDEDACVGHGRCYALAPAVFDADDMGRCRVLVAEPGPELEEAARAAVSTCPEDALRIEE